MSNQPNLIKEGYHDFSDETVNCEICGEKTHMLRLRRCPSCRAIENHILGDPKRVVRVLKFYMEKEEVKNENTK